MGIKTGLLGVRRINRNQSDAFATDLDGVNVDHASLAGNVVLLHWSCVGAALTEGPKKNIC